MLLPVLPDMLLRLVPIERLPHIERILAAALVLAGRVIAVVVDDAAEDAVAHLAVHGNGGVVAGADVEVDEPGVGLVAVETRVISDIDSYLRNNQSNATEEV